MCGLYGVMTENILSRDTERQEHTTGGIMIQSTIDIMQTLSDPGGPRHSTLETLSHDYHHPAFSAGTSHHLHPLLWSHSRVSLTEKKSSI